MASTGEAVRSGDRSARVRYDQLDSLRGVAALTVVFSHAAVIFAGPFSAVTYAGRQDGLLWWLYNTPLVALWSGPQAVALFFVLSGFVLALPFLDGAGPRYGDFMLRRWCRLWPPYMAAVLAALAIRLAVGGRPVGGLSDWFVAAWSSPFTLDEMVTHATMVLMADSYQTVPVLWSLTVELRVALIFPLLVWAVRRSGRATMGAALAVSVASAAAFGAGIPDTEGWFVTGVYLPTFVTGILLAQHRAQVVAWCSRLTRLRLAAAFGAALLLYTSRQVFLFDQGTNAFLPNLTVTAGCALLLALALGVPSAAAALRRGPLLFLGRISYSLYLVHAAVLLGAVHVFAGRVPLWLVLPAAVVASIPLAWVGYRWVELPSIRLGRRLSRALAESRTTSAPLPVPRSALR